MNREKRPRKPVEDMTDEEIAALDAVEDGKEHPSHAEDMVDPRQLEREQRRRAEEQGRG